MPDPLTIAASAKVAGSIFSAFGTRKRKKAIRRAVGESTDRINKFTDQFIKESGDIKNKKDDILANSGDVFDRIGGFIFGDGSSSLSSLRKAQEDFSNLAAGDTSGFQQETQAIVSSALANTIGGPRGSFENLSAKNLFDFRSSGLRNALSLNNSFADLGSRLINTEFGIIDNDFNARLRLEDNRVKQLNSLGLQRAGLEGSNLAAIGNVFNTTGTAISSLDTALNQRKIAEERSKLMRAQGRKIQRSINGFNPSAGSPFDGVLRSPERYDYDPNFDAYSYGADPVDDYFGEAAASDFSDPNFDPVLTNEDIYEFRQAIPTPPQPNYVYQPPVTDYSVTPPDPGPLYTDYEIPEDPPIRRTRQIPGGLTRNPVAPSIAPYRYNTPVAPNTAPSVAPNVSPSVASNIAPLAEPRFGVLPALDGSGPVRLEGSAISGMINSGVSGLGSFINSIFP